MALSEVTIFPRPIADAVDELPQARSETLLTQIAETSAALEGRVVWHVNTTARGGGVAEMLGSLVGYARGAGIDSRWRVISGDPRFFEITKRIHNRLHGSAGDGGALGNAAQADYESTLASSGNALRGLVSPGDIVVLHDPQTAGLAPLLADSGAHLVWRCHIGIDEPNAIAEETWSFLRPYVDAADELIFSRPEHIWAGIDHARVRIVAPAIDHRSPKNHCLRRESVDAILRVAEILPVGGDGSRPAFTRQNGEVSEVGRPAEMLGISWLDPDLPTVCQVSRWDRLKDPVGVLRGFAEYVLPFHDSQLVLAGPSASAVADDPEQAEVLDDLMTVLASFSTAVRNRVAIACLPMEDIEENAAIVNALQRLSDVIVQKSLAEGFGLTVSEAMWKGTPVVASGVGGIQDQIDHFYSGLLVEEPTDSEAFGDHINLLLREPEFADILGDAGRERVREEFLVARHLRQDVELYDDLLALERNSESVRTAA